MDLLLEMIKDPFRLWRLSLGIKLKERVSNSSLPRYTGTMNEKHEVLGPL